MTSAVLPRNYLVCIDTIWKKNSYRVFSQWNSREVVMAYFFIYQPLSSYFFFCSIVSVMVIVLLSSVTDRGIEPFRIKLKTKTNCICCFSKSSKSKRKDWLTRNQNNVYERSDMSFHRLLIQWASTIKIQLSVVVQFKADIVIISSNVSCSRHDMVKQCLWVHR